MGERESWGGRRGEEGESWVVMACLDIDPGFRDVTTVPQLSTPYTLARVRVPINTRHTYGRLGTPGVTLAIHLHTLHIHSSALKDAHRARARARVCARLWSTKAQHYRRPSGKSRSLFPNSRRPPIAPCEFRFPLLIPPPFFAPRKCRDRANFSIIARHKSPAGFHEDVICFLTLQFSSRDT